MAKVLVVGLNDANEPRNTVKALIIGTDADVNAFKTTLVAELAAAGIDTGLPSDQMLDHLVTVDIENPTNAVVGDTLTRETALFRDTTHP